ncbi:MAG: Fic family protein [Candidatus Eremiobacteraeota bacterium]|nr:Fic family protein [Candidatus Eremiobacteraeota bacterium]
MSRFLRQHWAPTLDSYGLARSDRQGCNYDAYIPDQLSNRTFVLEGSVAADNADAERNVHELDRRAVALGNTEALARILLRAEAVASSRIEGLEIGPRRLLQADAVRERSETSKDVTALDVLANIDAMVYAMDAVSVADDIAVDHLLEVHRRLLANTRLAEYAGSIRKQQNWIGGSSYNPCSAAFVPPPPELVADLLIDLCAFCNDDALPAAAQAAIAHAQFETIHPFVDGNGRVGRALIHMVLRRRGLARRVVPPVSLVLATRAEEYVNALTATRYSGDETSEAAARSINAWVSLFSSACIRAARDAESFEMRVAELQRQWRERLGTVRSHSAVSALIDALPGAPILTVKTAAELTRRSPNSINEAISRLVDAGILRPTNSYARNRTFESCELIEAFIDLERQLASPVGDTRVEPPVRPVPARPGTRP